MAILFNTEGNRSRFVQQLSAVEFGKCCMKFWNLMNLNLLSGLKVPLKLAFEWFAATFLRRKNLNWSSSQGLGPFQRILVASKLQQIVRFRSKHGSSA